MAVGFVVRKNEYYDSVFLMGVGKRLSRTEGVTQTAVLMATERNKQLLAELGIHGDQIDAAQPNDLVVAVLAETSQIMNAVLGKLDQALLVLEERRAVSHLRRLDDGLAVKPHANLAVLTIPGEYVFREAREALHAGLNLFIFSSNVPIEEERGLKELAAEKQLLVMGPDCGTSILKGFGIGFANNVNRGVFGVIGTSGTGLQEFVSQVHNAGYGISHAIGTGSRDLSDEIGGITTLQALDALEADAGTKVVSIITKPPEASTLERLVTRLESFNKPVVCCLLGATMDSLEAGETLAWAPTIDEAVLAAVQMAGEKSTTVSLGLARQERDLAARSRESWASEQRFLRGLFAGGTFCYQSQQILGGAGFALHSNAPLVSQSKLPDPNKSIEHTLIDMGDETHTLGRPHPMIDGTLRARRILTEGRDPSVAVLLLDFILGYNASMDPVGDVYDAIVEAKRTTQQRGGSLTIVASMCGTEKDLQDLDLQVKMLRETGAIVFHSNAKAALFCCELLKPG